MSNEPSTKPPVKPDLGLYQAKYWLRDILRNIPGLAKMSPNVLSISAIIPGIFAAFFLFNHQWGWAMAAIACRMIINTLDGLIAEEYNKKTALGAYLNRVPGEFTDILIILAVAVLGEDPLLAITLVILTGWVQIFGILGLAAGGSTQSVGPCGQTDRLALIFLACLCALLGNNPWPIFVQLLCVGCAVTILLRMYRSIRELRKLDAA